MRSVNRLAVIAALFASCSLAEPAQGPNPSGPLAPPAEPARPVIVLDHPPAPPELAPLSAEFQADMANSQLQTYRYGQLTEQALALKKLCDTGFGPADLCPKPGPIDGLASGNPADIPTVAEICGPRTALTATLALADGRYFAVRAGSILPDGLHVTAVTEDAVRATAKSGGEFVLVFGGTGRVK